MGIFRAAHRCGEGGGGQKGPLPKICLTYPTMIKLDTVIPYLKKISKIFESRDTYTPNSAEISILPANFVISRNTDIDYILICNF